MVRSNFKAWGYSKKNKKKQGAQSSRDDKFLPLCDTLQIGAILCELHVKCGKKSDYNHQKSCYRNIDTFYQTNQEGKEMK